MEKDITPERKYDLVKKGSGMPMKDSFPDTPYTQEFIALA
jgi:hypothetical protein